MSGCERFEKEEAGKVDLYRVYLETLVLYLGSGKRARKQLHLPMLQKAWTTYRNAIGGEADLKALAMHLVQLVEQNEHAWKALLLQVFETGGAADYASRLQEHSPFRGKLLLPFASRGGTVEILGGEVQTLLVKAAKDCGFGFMVLPEAVRKTVRVRL